MTSLLPALRGASGRTDSPEAVRFGEHVLTCVQAPHERPRADRHLDVLLRNELGKIMKRSPGV